MRARLQTPLIFALLTLAAWQAIVMMADIPEYLLPAPSAIFASVDRSLAVQLAVTFVEALIGFVIASALAFGCAIMFVRFHTLEEGLFPIAIAVKTTPIVAVAPLLVIWLGTGWWSKIVAVMLICFFPVLVNAVKGLKAADAEYRELFQTLGASRAQEFRKLRIPYCLPYLFSALKISSSLAIVGAIVGEFVGHPGARLSHHGVVGASRNGNPVRGDRSRRIGGDHHVLRHWMDRTARHLLAQR